MVGVGGSSPLAPTRGRKEIPAGEMACRDFFRSKGLKNPIFQTFPAARDGRGTVHAQGSDDDNLKIEMDREAPSR